MEAGVHKEKKEKSKSKDKKDKKDKNTKVDENDKSVNVAAVEKDLELLKKRKEPEPAVSNLPTIVEREKKDKKNKKDKKDKKEKKEKLDSEKNAKVPKVEECAAEQKTDPQAVPITEKTVPPTEETAPVAEEEEEDGIAAAFALFDFDEDLNPEELGEEAVTTAKNMEARSNVAPQPVDAEADFWNTILDGEEPETVVMEEIAQEEMAFGMVVGPQGAQACDAAEAAVLQVSDIVVQELSEKLERVSAMYGASMALKGNILKIIGEDLLERTGAERVCRAITEHRLDLDKHPDLSVVVVPQEWLDVFKQFDVSKRDDEEMHFTGIERMQNDHNVLIVLEEEAGPASNSQYTTLQPVQAVREKGRPPEAGVVVGVGHWNKFKIKFNSDQEVVDIHRTAIKPQPRVGIFGRPRDRLQAELKIMIEAEETVIGTLANYPILKKEGSVCNGFGLEAVKLVVKLWSTCLPMKRFNKETGNEETEPPRLPPYLGIIAKASGCLAVKYVQVKKKQKIDWMGEVTFFAMLLGNRTQRWLAAQMLAMQIMEQEKEPICTVPDHLISDTNIVTVPQGVMGILLGTRRSRFFALMESTGTFIALSATRKEQAKRKRLDDEDIDYLQNMFDAVRGGVSIDAIIFGEERARLAAEVHVRIVIEDKFPGYHVRPEGKDHEIGGGMGLGIDKVWLSSDFEADATKTQETILAGASNGIVHATNRFVLLAGTATERERGREYLKWMTCKRHNLGVPHVADLDSRRDLCVVKAPESVLKTKNVWMLGEMEKLACALKVVAFIDDYRESDGTGRIVLAGSTIENSEKSVSEVQVNFQDLVEQFVAWKDGKSWKKQELTWKSDSRNSSKKDSHSSSNVPLPATPAIGIGAQPPMTPAVGVGVRPPATPAIGIGVQPPMTPGVGVRPPSTPAIGVGVQAPSTPAIGVGVRPPSTPAIGVGVQAPCTPAIGVGVRPPSTPAIGVGVQAPSTPAIGVGVQPPSTPAIGIRAPSTPAIGVGVQPPATPAFGFGPHGSKAPSTPGTIGSVPCTPANFGPHGNAVPSTPGAPGSAPCTPANFGPHGARAPSTPGTFGSAPCTPANFGPHGARMPSTPGTIGSIPATPFASSVPQPQTPAVGGGIRPPQTPAVGTVRPPQTPSVGPLGGIKPPQTPAVGNGIKPPQTLAVGNGIKPPQTPAVGNGIKPPQTPAVGGGLKPPQTPALISAASGIKPPQTPAAGSSIRPPQTPGVNQSVAPPRTPGALTTKQLQTPAALSGAVRPPQTPGQLHNSEKPPQTPASLGASKVPSPQTPAALATQPQAPPSTEQAPPSVVRRSASGLLVPSARKSSNQATEAKEVKNGSGSSSVGNANTGKTDAATLAAKANALLEARRAAKKAAGK